MSFLIALPLLVAFLWAQRYWFLRLWRAFKRLQSPILRRIALSLTLSTFGLVAAALFGVMFSGRRDLIWSFAGLMGAIGLWISTAFFSWFLIQLVAGARWTWRWTWHRARRLPSPGDAAAGAQSTEVRPDARADVRRDVQFDVQLGRRRFVQGATAFAGAIPFGLGAYGFLIGRHAYRVHEVDLPLAALPRELDGLRIAQLSDIHIGSYMSAAEVRRAVAMANELNPDLSVVTGDFITGPRDPLEVCISELAGLRAPLGVWGCNGNHEIYADAQEESAKLFAQHGMKLLRQENAEIDWRGGKFNLVGVDYQLARSRSGRRLAMLSSAGSLMRRGMPNILLSHNPNSFPRAAELGMDLMLTGHTHGGQVRVEILDRHFSPARFLTPYEAGLYKRPLGSPSALEDAAVWSAQPSAPASLVYVNRGLGTIGAPIRLGVPPEISLLTLRCA
jgi:uncharacterized protein